VIGSGASGTWRRAGLALELTLLAAPTLARHRRPLLLLLSLTTPVNLNWHLSTAGARTMVAGTMALLVGMFFLLSSFEVTGEKIEQPGPGVQSGT
jgi:hypothetical protein